MLSLASLCHVSEDLPYLVPQLDRRQLAERRVAPRGGRRQDDWDAVPVTGSGHPSFDRQQIAFSPLR